MSRSYLVGIADAEFRERAFGILDAPDRYEAIMRFLEDLAPTSNFAEYVLGTAINASLAERFWFKSPEEYHCYLAGEFTLDEDAFRQRVRRFFSDSPRGSEYADLYTQWYFTQGLTEEPATSKYTYEELLDCYADRFPARMWAYMWFHGEFSDVIAVPLENLPAVNGAGTHDD